MSERHTVSVACAPLPTQPAQSRLQSELDAIRSEAQRRQGELEGQLQAVQVRVAAREVMPSTSIPRSSNTSIPRSHG